MPASRLDAILGAAVSVLRHDPRPDAELLTRFLDERSEEHTSELQSRLHLVCRLLLEKKKKNIHMFLCRSSAQEHPVTLYTPARLLPHLRDIHDDAPRYLTKRPDHTLTCALEHPHSPY